MNHLRFILLPALLLLVQCGTVTPGVFSVSGQQQGTIRVIDDADANVLDAYGGSRGSVHGDTVRDAAGNRMGRVVTRQAEVLILGPNGTLFGTLRDSTDCYGRDQSLLGHIDTKIQPEFAGGGCLLLLMNKP